MNSIGQTHVDNCHRDINLVGIGLVRRRGCRDGWVSVRWIVGRGVVVLVILVCVINVVGGWIRTRFWRRSRWIAGKLCRWKGGGCGAAGLESEDGYCELS